MKIGLVLPGGGGKGAYQIGVIKALEKLGIRKYIKYVAGTSIGALNALLFVQGDIEKAEEVWKSISTEKILPTDNLDLMKKGILLTIGAKNLNFVKKYMPSTLQQGNISRDGLLEIADKYLNVDVIQNSDIVSYATCTDIESLNVRYFKYNEYDEVFMKKIILGTSALPAIYEPEEIEGRYYIDGGLVDNIPVQPLYGEGCDLIIVAYLGRECVINKGDYPNTKIIEIFPSYMEEGVLKGTLNFSQEILKSRIRRGYDDTINALEPIMELTMFCNSKRVISKNINQKQHKIGFFEGLRERIYNNK
ncbi:MAG: patatin-like phospholipase family protein [Sarcina sp.]